MPAQSVNASVTLPVGQAIDRAKLLLFQPFDLGKWFVIGFGAWLAHLGESGFGGGFNFSPPNQGGGRRGGFDDFGEFVVNNLHWIIPLVLAIVLLSVAFGVLLTWLSSRGRFIFLHCVTLNKADVVEPWRKYALVGNSLFWFRLVVGLASFVVILPLIALIAFTVIRMIRAERVWAGGIAIDVVAVLAIIVLGVGFAIVSKLTTDFVVPIQYLRGSRCLEAWREVMNLMSANAGQFVLYILFQIVIEIVTGMIVLAVVLGTCCVAGCLFAIPFLGTVALLPILAFKRAYSVHYLAQYGKEFDAFTAVAPWADGLSS